LCRRGRHCGDAQRRAELLARKHAVVHPRRELLARVDHGDSAAFRGRQRREIADQEKQHADAEEGDDARQSGKGPEVEREQLDDDDRQQRGTGHPQRTDRAARRDQHDGQRSCRPGERQRRLQWLARKERAEPPRHASH
jgi:hypothetical protein